jgi:hypothetical protein
VNVPAEGHGVHYRLHGPEAGPVVTLSHSPAAAFNDAVRAFLAEVA